MKRAAALPVHAEIQPKSGMGIWGSAALTRLGRTRHNAPIIGAALEQTGSSSV